MFVIPIILYGDSHPPQSKPKNRVMKKEEVVHLHKLLVHVKKYFEGNGLDCDFEKYNELGITPLDMQRSKEEHKRAIFVLASEMASKAAKKLSCGEKIELIPLQDELFF